MPIPFEGGCHCGAVRYVCSEEPTTVVDTDKGFRNSNEDETAVTVSSYSV